MEKMIQYVSHCTHRHCSWPEQLPKIADHNRTVFPRDILRHRIQHRTSDMRWLGSNVESLVLWTLQKFFGSPACFSSAGSMVSRARKLM